MKKKREFPVWLCRLLGHSWNGWQKDGPAWKGDFTNKCGRCSAKAHGGLGLV